MTRSNLTLAAIKARLSNGSESVSRATFRITSLPMECKTRRSRADTGRADGHICADSAYVELLQEPPGLPVEGFQGLITAPLIPDANGDVHLPAGPGLGVELTSALERVG